MNTNEAYEHDRTVTAFFDTRAAAEKAKANVVAAGVPMDMVTIVAGHDPHATATATRDPARSVEPHPEYSSTSGSPYDPARSVEPHPEGFWGSLKNLFAPEEDKHSYAEGLSRGGFLLTAHTNNAHYDRVIDILDDEGAVNMDEREAQWKSEGWSGRHDGAPAVGSSMAAARGLETPVATSPKTSKAATLGTAAPAAAHDATVARGAPVAGAAVGARGVGPGEETIQLAEETLRVGKRDVDHGRVRLRSYVVEKPVSETVNLRGEQINVDRRPVDRALGAGENLFQERTISAEQHAEEAVVSKEARVYEEVGLSKTATDRTEEIKDKVRRTELEVDDGRTNKVGGVTTGRTPYTPGTAGVAGQQIVEHMNVLASDGTHIGTVDHLDTGDRIKLTKGDSSDGLHHYIPQAWVDHVDSHVHLNKTSAEVRNGWQAA